MPAQTKLRLLCALMLVCIGGGIMIGGSMVTVYRSPHAGYAIVAIGVGLGLILNLVHVRLKKRPMKPSLSAPEKRELTELNVVLNELRRTMHRMRPPELQQFLNERVSISDADYREKTDSLIRQWVSENPKAALWWYSLPRDLLLDSPQESTEEA